MSKLFSAREICVLALRKIGRIAPHETAGNDSDILIALQYLDTIISEKAGTTRLWSLVPQELTFTYAANSDSVNITSLLGTTPLDMFRAAYIDATDEEITLIRRDEFDTYKNSGLFPFTTARVLYIASDGDDTYTAYLRPAITEDLVIRITGQKFPPTMTGATGSSNDLSHGFEKPWQRWMYWQLSFELGDGPLARIPEDRLDRWAARADMSWALVQGYRGGGQRKYGRFTKAYNG